MNSGEGGPPPRAIAQLQSYYVRRGSASDPAHPFSVTEVTSGPAPAGELPAIILLQSLAVTADCACLEERAFRRGSGRPGSWPDL
jgi:hypothetical protein